MSSSAERTMSEITALASTSEGDIAESEFVALMDSISADDDKDYCTFLLTQSIWLDESVSLRRVKRLLEAGASANALVDDSSKRSALHVAAIRNWVKMCELLLEHGANANTKDTRGWTARKAAFYHGCRAASDSLRLRTAVGTEAEYTTEVGRASDVDPKDMSERLRIGAITGNVDDVKAVLRELGEIAGKDEEKVDDLDFIDSCSVLDRADEAQRNPLCYAAALGHTEIVRLLLEAGANPNVWIKYDHITPLGLAACRGHIDVVDLLLTSDGVRSSDRNACYLHAIYRRDAALLQSLLRSEPNPERQNLIELALFQACTVGFLEAVQQLISHGVNLNSSSWMVRGETPIMRSVAMGHTSITSSLIEHNAVLTGTYDPFGKQQSILHRAVVGGNALTLRRLLVLCPASLLNEVDKDGASPLHYACCYNQHSAVQALLEAGAHRDLQRSDGKLASEVAGEKGHVACAQYVATFFPSLVHICIASLSQWCPSPLKTVAAVMSLPETLCELVLWRYAVPWCSDAGPSTPALQQASRSTPRKVNPNRKQSLAGYV